METWLRNTTETDLMITCNHVSADGQFDSDAACLTAMLHDFFSSTCQLCNVMIF